MDTQTYPHTRVDMAQPQQLQLWCRGKRQQAHEPSYESGWNRQVVIFIAATLAVEIPEIYRPIGA